MVLLDQTRLPGERVERSCRTVAELIDAIQVLAIRGAPALGVAGAMGIALAARTAPEHPRRDAPVPGGAGRRAGRGPADRREPRVGRRRGAGRAGPRGRRTRRRRAGGSRRGRGGSTARRSRAAGPWARTARRCSPTAAHLMTQCNTGGARDRRLRHRARRRARAGRARRRPARLGARDAAAAAGRAPDGVRAGRGGHPRTPSSTDNATGAILREGGVAGIVVGADRIAANGDTANKIGTYNLAVLAHHHGVPFYVVAPTSTIDPATPSGDAIPIEQRAGGRGDGLRRRRHGARRHLRRATTPSTSRRPR